MNKIVLKLSKKRNNIKLIQSKEELRKAIEKRHQKLFEQVKVFEEQDIKLTEASKELDNLAEELIDVVEEILPAEEELQEELTENIDNIDNIESIESIEEAKAEELTDVVEDTLDLDIAEIDEELRAAFFDEPLAEVLASETEAEPAAKSNSKTIFTEIYTISENDAPVEILIEQQTSSKISLEEAKAQVQAAYQQGFDDCQEMAQINAQTKVSAAYQWVQRVDNFIVNLRQHYSRQLADLNEKVLELAAIFAGTIIEKEIRADNNIILTQIRKILTELDEDTVFTIRAHPDMLDFLVQAKVALVNQDKKLADTAIVSDASLGYGDCILLTSAGNIEARIAAQLEILRNEILDINKSSAGINGIDAILQDADPVPAVPTNADLANIVSNEFEII